MNKKVIKITAIIIAVLFVLAIASPLLGVFVFAEKDEKIIEYEKKEKSALETLQAIEKQLNEAGEEIYQTQQILDSVNEKLEEINKELAEAEQKEREQADKYKERVTAICEGGGLSYIGLIFSADSFSDLIDKLVIAKEMTAYDKNILDSMVAVKSEIESKKADAEALKAEQESSKATLEKSMNDLYKQSADAAAYIEELKTDKAEYERYLKEKEEEEKRAKQKAGLQSSGTAADLSKVSDGMFLWPTNSDVITSAFSPNRVNPVTGVLRAHTGTDIGASYGAPIWAAQSGTVTLAEYNGGYGNCVVINHGNGVSTLYAHMSAILVSKGETVDIGTQIGRVGSTGNSTGPHLHFEVLIDGTAVDAMQFF